MELYNWAEELTRQVFSQWKTNHAGWKQGFKLFYSPIKKNPKLLILSYNPGGDKNSFKKELEQYENGNFSLPKNHEFTTKEYRMARRMCDFFIGYEKTLKMSVTLPIFFFRSKNVNILDQNLAKQERKLMQAFCDKLIEKIIFKLEPKNILILGMATYDHLNKTQFHNLESNTRKDKKNHRVSIETKWNGKPIFVIKHPTGRDPTSNQDWETNKKRFFDILE